MAAPTFDVSKNSRAGVSRATRADGECLRYRLDVVAASAADVVQSAGGWLYDRAMAGWEVTVLLPERCDPRALRILGVRVLELETQLAALGAGSTSQSLAVSAEAFTADARVRDTVLQSLETGLTEVALWGQAPQGWPLRVNRAMTSGRPVVRLDSDGFHHIREHRYRQGRDSARGYYEVAGSNRPEGWTAWLTFTIALSAKPPGDG